MTADLDLSLALDAAERACRAAADAALPYYRGGVSANRKADGSLVTAADQAAERAALAVIRDAFPSHSILTEESGAHPGDPRTRWILDPLDGTHRFARGLRFWGPLVALEHGGEIVAGAAALPALGEVYTAARGLGAERNGEPIRVSTVDTWRDANIAVGSLARLLDTPAGGPALDLIGAADYCVAGGDLEGALLVARGEADLWIEAGVRPWDVAPFKVIIEEAGGRFTDLTGACSLDAPVFVAANAPLHADALSRLGGARRPVED
ncbi:MAG: inositol phosphatase [Planctomycetota bacterium]|nr:MAG: inositol phosphatase [Planctomycetota bacterium]